MIKDYYILILICHGDYQSHKHCVSRYPGEQNIICFLLFLFAFCGPRPSNYDRDHFDKYSSSERRVIRFSFPKTLYNETSGKLHADENFFLLFSTCCHPPEIIFPNLKEIKILIWMTSAYISLFCDTNEITNDSVKNQQLASYENSISRWFSKNQSIDFKVNLISK